MKKKLFVVIAIVALLAIGFGAFYYFHPHNYKITMIAEPTCIQDGTTNYACWCGNQYDEHPSALAHTYEESITQEANCVENGTKTYTCSRCKDTYNEELPATGHNYVEEIKDAECEVAGYIRNTCSKCNETNEEEIPALEHEYEMTETDTEKIYTCTLCEDSYSEKKPKKKSAPAGEDPTIGKTEAGPAGLSPEQQAFLDSIGAAPVTDVMQSSGVAHVDRETSVDISGVTLH